MPTNLFVSMNKVILNILKHLPKIQHRTKQFTERLRQEGKCRLFVCLRVCEIILYLRFLLINSKI